MLPEESVQAYFDLKAKRYFPVHRGMFELAFHAWYESINKISKYAEEKGIELVAPRLGEVTYIDNQNQLKYLWSKVEQTS